MQYRRFGRTELAMPVFSCGGMRYQHAWKDLPLTDIPAANQRNLEAIIHRSIELGMNHIETARAYGTSEIQLGQILPRLPRENLIIQTKVEPFADARRFVQTVERSLRLLQLDHVDLLGIHGINTSEHLEWCLGSGGCVEAAQRLRDQGKIRFLGFSTHAPTAVIKAAIDSGQFDYVNLHWYYIFQDNWPAILAAQQQDMGVFIISPSNKGGELYNPPEKLQKLCAPLSPMVFNDLFCLSHPQVHTLSIGAAQPSDFDEHLKTLEWLPQAETVLAPILDRLESAAIEALGAHWYHTWREGLPAPEETPGNLNIPAMLWLRNLALAFDLTEFAKNRYNLFENGGHWFPGARADHLASLDLSACLARSPHRDRIPQLLAETHQLLQGAKVKRLSQGG
ncbi:MAG: aldo/keto reductase [Prochlorothrix sp.]|nr:aldo/keto reductase [Prochlorothrix sp.]